MSVLSAEQNMANVAQSGVLTQILARQFTELVETEQKKLDARATALQEQLNEWNKISADFDVSQLSDPVVFNVGGTKFSISMDSLKSLPDTYFSHVVGGKWQLKVSKDGSIFINRSPVAFGYLMDFLKDPNSIQLVYPRLTPLELYHLEKDCDFYLLPQLLNSLPKPPCELKMSRQAFVTLQSTIGFSSLSLLYRWAKNGAGVKKFIKKCDHRGATIVFASVADGSFIGAFSSVSRDSSTNDYVSDPNALLFKINSGQRAPETFGLRTRAGTKKAVLHSASRGPVFGAGPDFDICLDGANPSFSCGPARSTYAPHGIDSKTQLKDVFVYAVQM